MLAEFDGYMPQVAPGAFIAPTAVLIGNVVVHDEASVWFGAVLRGDHGVQGIEVGAGSNIQDNCVIHVGVERGTTIHERVTVGHGAILEACEIHDGAVIGMNVVVLEHAVVGSGSMIAAGSTVLAHSVVPPNCLAAGVPASVKKPITGRSQRWIEQSARHYVDLARRYRDLSAREVF